MSRFYGTASNGRGGTTSWGGRQPAGQCHLRGWNAGVRVVPIGNKNERDRFEVYMTYGSHASGRDVLLGIVHDTEDGPQFIPDGEEDTEEAISTLAIRNGGEYRHPSHP